VSNPKLADVNWMSVTLVPVTRCEPPEGVRCFLQNPNASFTSADAKRHALEHPGHYVLRETVTRTEYLFAPDDAEGVPDEHLSS